MRNIFFFIFEVSKIIVIALLIVLPIRYFIFQPFFVRGQSMEPNFHNGDYLIVDEISYRFTAPQRGEVVVFRYPQDPSQRYIKRIVGLPGETIYIQDGQVVISGSEGLQVLNESVYLLSSLETSGDLAVHLDKNDYFVLGDNRSFSSDSRRWGLLPRENIVGRVFLRVWPFTAMATMVLPEY